ncbi:MAG TPA: universal stress protein [Candidatus Limnocylindrales bacterium]
MRGTPSGIDLGTHMAPPRPDDAQDASREHRGIPQIVLATDLSAVSVRAADRAIELAVERAAHLIVLSVVDPTRLRLPGGLFLRRIDEERTRVERGAQAIVLRARAVGARATFLVWEGEAAETILAAAEAELADLIVLGTHGRGRLGRLVLGSISARVSEAATCEVLIVPGGAHADPAGHSAPTNVPNAPSA